jgi:bifunctional ADP-heptose synthase (sugar kinase/adenylyltransferase)
LALAAKADLISTLEVVNFTVGIVVGKIGTATICVDISEDISGVKKYL